MDTPESRKISATTSGASAVAAAVSSSNSPPVQESPFSNFASSLSPLDATGVSHLSTRFPGLSSPPLVFTSPYVNQIREVGFLRRPQNFHLLSAGAIQHDDGNKDNCEPGHFDKSAIELCNNLTADPHDAGVKNSEEVQSSNSSDRIDEFLVDSEERDCTISEYQVNQNQKRLDDVVEFSTGHGNDDADSEMQTFGGKGNGESHEKDTSMLSEQSEFCNKEGLKAEKKLEIGQKLCSPRSDAASQFKSQEICFQNAKGDCRNECELASEMQGEMLPMHMQTAQPHGDFGKSMELVSQPVNITTFDTEAGQLRGMSRRCLQFEEARPKEASNLSGSQNLPCQETVPSSSGFAVESETFDSNPTSDSRQLVNASQPVDIRFSSCDRGKAAVLVSKPSGIGLHLNSIIRAAPSGQSATESMKPADDSTSAKGMKLASITICPLPGNANELSNSAVKVSASSEHSELGKEASVVASAAVPESLQTIGSTILTHQADDRSTLKEKRKSMSEKAESFEELSLQSPKKKKKKSSSGADDDGCKRCNCKRTKCLKLYCDCFAAGIYCSDTCSCKGCLNRPEHKDTVMETRQLIESRNPLAFAPKIIQHGSEMPLNVVVDDTNLTTPSSARHKRGCNCKKSMCLKKYCECYQGNVGCSSACRCEGCKNVYGKRDGKSCDANECMNVKRKLEMLSPVLNLADELMSSRSLRDISQFRLDDKLEKMTTRKEFSQVELYNPHKLTPVTPSFQHSDNGKGAAKSQLLVRTYRPSPDSGLSSYAKSLGNLDSSNMTLETGEDFSTIVPYEQETGYSDLEASEYLHSRYGSLVDVCNLTPPPDPPPMAAVTSSASSNVRDLSNVSQLHFCSGTANTSLHWCNSPVTPGALGLTSSPQCLDSDTGLYNIFEDDTPDILRNSSAPIKSVKVSSPNRKRVSPPHHRLNEPGSSSSGALKSGRKFILKAVPSFPPLTPCMESKGLTNQTTDNTQQHLNKQ